MLAIAQQKPRNMGKEIIVSWYLLSENFDLSKSMEGIFFSEGSSSRLYWPENSSLFIKRDVLSPCSQELASSPYSEPDWAIPVQDFFSVIEISGASSGGLLHAFPENINVSVWINAAE